MSRVFVFVLFISFSHADYLNTADLNHCIRDLTPNQNSTGWCYLDVNQNRNECNRRVVYSDFIDGYEFVNNECVLKNDLRITGLTQNQLNYQFALMGNFVGFTFLFLLSYLAILISRRKG